MKRRRVVISTLGLLALAFVAVAAATSSTIYPTWNSCQTQEYAIAWGGNNAQSIHTDTGNCADEVRARIQWNNGGVGYFSSWDAGPYQGNVSVLNTAMTVAWGNAQTNDPLGSVSSTFVTGAVYP